MEFEKTPSSAACGLRLHVVVLCELARVHRRHHLARHIAPALDPSLATTLARGGESSKSKACRVGEALPRYTSYFSRARQLQRVTSLCRFLSAQATARIKTKKNVPCMVHLTWCSVKVTSIRSTTQQGFFLPQKSVALNPARSTSTVPQLTGECDPRKGNGRMQTGMGSSRDGKCHMVDSMSKNRSCIGKPAWKRMVYKGWLILSRYTGVSCGGNGFEAASTCTL